MAAQAADGKVWIERKSRLCSGPRLIQCAEQAQGSGEPKMGERKVAVGLNASSQPTDCFGIRTELYLGDADNMHPPVGKDIARGETESLLYMAFGLGGATHKKLGDTDRAVSVGQIAIQRQCLLAFSNPLGRAVCKNVDATQDPVGRCVVRGQ